MRDANDHSVHAIVKRANVNTHRYSLGMERVAYRLGTDLGLPIAATFLELFEGEPASVQLRVEGARTWDVCRILPLQSVVTNEELWPLAAVFDIWLANTDRNTGNVMYEPLPTGTPVTAATKSKFWLIDHGQAGLWPGWKLTGNNADKNNIPDTPAAAGTGSCHDATEQHIRTMMAPPLETALVGAAADLRGRALDAVRQVGDDAIDHVVAEVPADYLTDLQAEALVTFLKARRFVLDRVISRYWC